ncbi:MAG: corrinoid protein [Candidatus Aminicenantes bacterium]|nr:corrinoid protein [Candidatus Aminicenantes bacterium]
MDEFLEKIKENIIEGRVDSQDEGFDGTKAGQPGVTELVQEAVNKKISPVDILTKCLNPGMEEVGSLYEKGEYLTPDMLASAECVKAAMKLLDPLLVNENIQNKGKIIMATVQGDLHDIGKNIVSTLLRGSGYEVLDLGTDVSVGKIVETVKETKARLVGLSALLTSTMGRMEDVVEKLKKEGLRKNVKVLIGGAPISMEFADKIGADFYCTDAFDAINKLEA